MATDFKDIKLYRGTTFADVLKEIHTNQKNKEEELKTLIGNLKPLINTAGDAVIIVPLIKDYLNTSVKNDENLIKMATIVQRVIAANSKGDDGELKFSDEEKEQLLNEVQNLKLA